MKNRKIATNRIRFGWNRIRPIAASLGVIPLCHSPLERFVVRSIQCCCGTEARLADLGLWVTSVTRLPSEQETLRCQGKWCI